MDLSSQEKKAPTLVIDSHVHIGAIGKDYQIVTAQDLQDSMDNAGIAISIVVSDDFDSGDDWQGVSSDEAIKQCANNPRLKVVGNFSLRREAAQQEHEICQQIETKAICGVKFYPGYENYFPVDQRPQTIYKLCATLRVPVIFHTGFLQEGTLGNQEQTHPRNIEALAEQHPDLKIIMAHFGNPWVQETAKAIAKHNNLYVDLSGFFTEYKTVLSTELVEFQGAMTTFANIAGGFSKCLFGTDWPLYSQKEYLAAVKTLPMNEREQKLVFWENATLLFDR